MVLRPARLEVGHYDRQGIVVAAVAMALLPAPVSSRGEAP
eukprot:COSAG05_NODE_4_length_49189_cov_157.128784_10_plen_40_part_00